jgi:arylsulfatase A-like enzyme
MEECLDHLTQQAVQFIRDHAGGDRPFFLYFPLSAPHKPVLPHPRFRGRTELGPYGDFVVQVDHTVGQVLNALEEAKASENTLVIYSSDNGSFMYRRDGKDHVDDHTVQAYRAEHHTANGVLRGTKADVWEAGHRVPFFARWPQQIEPGSRCDATVCLVDILATAADLVGADKPDSAEDSFSMLPLMRGSRQHDRPPVIHHSGSGMFAIRVGEWKLVLGNGSGGREKPVGKPFAKPYRLFNLSDDLSETQDVIQQHPEVAAALEQRCLQIIGDDR